MSKISAIINNNSSFRSFDWSQKTNYSPSPYYYDKERARRENLKESEILTNDFSINKQIIKHKIANTLSVYPVKGFSGDKNSNFYEYLTMGMFPYITGSLTFIALFNGISKHLNLNQAAAAKKYGLGMALGVIFYGLAKTISNKLVTIPVKMKTGIDMDMPCRNVVNLIATTPEQYKAEEERQEALKKAGEYDTKSFEYHKVFESVDFPRFDLLYKKQNGIPRNKYFDEIAEKNGFGKDLRDSDQEIKPFIKEVVTKAKTAQNMSQYFWAAVGVGLGVQEPWAELLKIKEFSRGMNIKDFVVKTSKHVGNTALEACKSFINGGVKGARKTSAKIAGRTILGLAVLTSVLGTLNAIKNPYIKNNEDMKNSNVFKNNKNVTED